MKKILLLPLFTLLLFTGCAHVISEENLKKADQGVTFAKLRENPESYLGKYLLVGGTIAATRNSKDGAELEVVQFELDRSGVPEDSFHSGGRFLVAAPELMDPLIYKPGRMVTVVGEVKGKKVMPFDETDYSYPLLSLKEIHVFKAYEEGKGYPYPTPGYYNYDPYYWGFEPGPYWYRPMGPVYKRY